MEGNLNWLWAAFSLAWALVVGYVTVLSGHTRRLEGQLENLRAELEERDLV